MIQQTNGYHSGTQRTWWLRYYHGRSFLLHSEHMLLHPCNRIARRHHVCLMKSLSHLVSKNRFHIAHTESMQFRLDLPSQVRNIYT